VLLVLVPMAILGITILNSTIYAINKDTKERIIKEEIKFKQEIDANKLIRNKEEQIVKEFIQEEIEAASKDKPIIVEGAAFLPELMQGLKFPGERYICITPEKGFQIEHYKQREWVPYVLEGCSDKEQAFANWMERDALFAEAVRKQCETAGYVSLVTDGSRSVEEVVELVCRQFGLKGRGACDEEKTS